MCNFYNEDRSIKGTYLVSGCNEVTSFTNIATGEVDYKIYHDDALYGQVTCIKASSDVIAIGYSSGTILVYDLTVAFKTIDQRHNF